MNRPRSVMLVISLLGLACYAVACGDGTSEPTAPDPPRATTVEVTPSAAELTALGETARFSARVLDQNGQAMAGAAVSWSSGDAAVATVDASGLATAAGNGTATITATSGSASGTAAVTVAQVVSAVAVAPAVDTLVAFGDTVRLTAEATDANGHIVAGAEFSWSSSDTLVARVDETGLVEGVAEGTARITATAGDASGTAEITVENPDRAALVALYEATDGPKWVDNTNWLTDAPLGEWYGVDTDGEGRVRSLSLFKNGLSGTLPPEVGGLAKLGVLSLTGNELSGPIPPALGRLADLTRLALNGNRLSGSVPPALGHLVNLESLQLSQTKLSGPVPRSFLQLANLRSLNFGATEVCAPGTTTFVDWLNGRDFYWVLFCNLSDRAVLESVYEAVGGVGWTNSEGWLGEIVLANWHGVRADSLGRVAALDLGDNGLVGRLPPQLGELAGMTELRIGGNPRLTGRLPLSLAKLPLRVLHFAATDLCIPVEDSFRRWLGAVPSHDGTSVECAPLSDRDILVAFYDATGGPNWIRGDNWLTNAPLRDWYGVDTDRSGRVVSLEWRGGNNLSGPIPSELGNLANLTRLSVVWNDLSGPIPSKLGDLANLTVLSLAGNDLSGRIPSKLGGLANLRVLQLHSNELNGLVPSELGNLANLTDLILLGNDLSGPIPPELSNLTNLERLLLSENDLSGPIPPEIGSLTSLTDLILSDNALTGPIPLELGGLASLIDLDVSGNALTGPIPSELGGLASLIDLDVSGNALTGPIPSEFGSLAKLQSLNLARNDLSGSVPPEFGKTAVLRDLILSENARMSGPLPSSLTNLQSLETLVLSGTDLCAPSTVDFLEWLEGIASRRVSLCGAELATAYLTQSVQSREFPVALVAGEEALLRVFPTASRSNGGPFPRVRASFYLDDATAHVADIPSRARTVPTEVNEGSLSGSANALVPAEVVQPGLKMVVEIDPEQTVDPKLAVARRIPETGRMAIDVRTMPVLNLTVVPFLWTHDPDSTVLESVAAMTADPEGHELLWGVRTLLPVGALEAAAHMPVLSSNNSAGSLLMQTEAIRVVEGGTGHYMGTMTGVVRGAGIAQRPGRASYSELSPLVIAHELGHNMNLPHAPCGAAGDPFYPHPDAGIGAWGYDVRGEGILVSPTGYRDLMSYCHPQWVSDYHFDKALRFRLADEGPGMAAAMAAPTESLLLWGGIDAEGAPFLEPAFVIDAPPALPDSAGAYRISGETASGATLFSVNFTMPEVADGDGSSGFAFVLPVRSGWERDLASILLTGPGGSFTLDGDSDLPMTILQDPRTGRIRGFLRDEPLAAQAAAAAAGYGVGRPGLETLFSRGIPAAAAWRR